MDRSTALLFCSLFPLASLVGCAGDKDKDNEETGDDTGDDTGVGDDTDSGEPDREVRAELVPLSATGSDAFYAVAFAADGGFYAAGFVADSVDATADREMAIARFTAEGDLDTTFGTDGVVRINVAEGGTSGELARGVVVQSTGKVVVAGSIEHDVAAEGTAASDRDIALLRLNADGTVDTDFGKDGVLVLDLNTGVETVDDSGEASWSGADAFYDLELAAGDALVIHGATRADGYEDDGTTPRSDTDFALVRLSADGELDASFADGGVFTLDIEAANASARHVTVLSDGSLVGGGYANTPTFGTTQPVVYKVTPDGELDASFADEGLFHQEVLAEVAEVYAVTVVGDALVTAGYGRNTSDDANDWLSLRLDMEGNLDSSWGSNGAVQFDYAGFGDSARTILTLPSGEPLIVGGMAVADSVTDAAYGVPQADGTLGSGPVLYDFGGVSDMFWGASVSPDQSTVAIVGVKGAGSGATADDNDDAAIYLLPLE